MLVGTLLLSACGGPADPAATGSPSPAAASPSASPSATASPSPTPSTTSPTPSPSETTTAAADEVVVDITIADGEVTPNGEKVDVDRGQEVVLNVTSDTDDEIHAHTGRRRVRAGGRGRGADHRQLQVASAGSFEVESHQLEKIIVILNVR